MNVPERLRQAIEGEQSRLRAEVPSDRSEAILALLRIIDRLPYDAVAGSRPDLVSGHRLANLGGNRALQLCLEAGKSRVALSAPASDGFAGWAVRFLQRCGRLAEAELVLGHCETGFMRMVEDTSGTFEAWIATKVEPTSWRERADVDWWAAQLATRREPELRVLQSERPAATDSGPQVDAYYRRLANVRLEMMAYQIGYPEEAEIGGCAVQTYGDVLARLMAWTMQARDRGEAMAPRSERTMIGELAGSLAIEPAVTERAMAAFTLCRENAAYHAAVPGAAAAPLIRLGPDRIVWSAYGLMTEPLFFLARELRRRDAEGYHNSAALREAVFRRDLYALFADKRFVTGAGRIALRREAGDVRTDIDAIVFDRKSGSLGLFELKSQDPFARSTAELARQRDNVLYANRQISGALAWLQRNGADALLSRVDPRTAKTFRVQKVFPFVLGRYLVRFSDGVEPDRRAGWGTWPQVLRLRDGQPFAASETNPLASLFNRLRNDVSAVRLPAAEAPREIDLGVVRLIVHPSYADFRTNADDAATG